MNIIDQKITLNQENFSDDVIKSPTSSRLAKCIDPLSKDACFEDVPIPKYITITPPKHNKYLNGNKDFKSCLSSNTSTSDYHNEGSGEGIDTFNSSIDPYSYTLSINPPKLQNIQEGSPKVVKPEIDDLHSNDDINPYNVKSLEEILDGVDPIEYKTMIRDYSPRMFKRIDKCGHMVFEFKASACNGSTYISSQCHSDLCYECVRNDRRTYHRVINYIGNDLLENVNWLKLVITIPKDIRRHFLSYDTIDKFTNGIWDLLSNVLDLNADERYDRGGAVFKWHWFGTRNDDFNPHLEVMVPCIRYGQPFEANIPQDKLVKIKRGIARRLSNITEESIPLSRMNIKVKPKTKLGQILHAFKYMLRSTINFKGLMNAPKAVKQFMVDGRHGKKQVRYKGKLWSTELKDWYKYLGLNYETRNKYKKPEWVDDNDVPYKFVNSHNKLTLNNELKQYGTELRSISRVSYCTNHPKVVNQKINEIVKSGLESNNNKVVSETIFRLKNFNPDGHLMSWTREVIILSLSRKNYMIENEGITTDICKQQIKYIKSMNKDAREHWLSVGSGDESENVRTGFPTKTTNSIKGGVEM